MYISALIYFIDYLVQILQELTEKLLDEINLSKEGREKEVTEAKKSIALKLIQEDSSHECIADLIDLSIEEIKKMQKEHADS